MDKKMFRMMLVFMALLPASVIIVSGFLSTFLVFIFPSLMNLAASVFWTSLGAVYILFTLDTIKMFKKK